MVTVSSFPQMIPYPTVSVQAISVFYPVLPFHVDVHMMKQLDSIHYQNNEHCGITMIGMEIRTEYGFSPRRLLYVIKTFNLSVYDAKTLLCIRQCAVDPKVSSFRIIVISSSFVAYSVYSNV